MTTTESVLFNPGIKLEDVREEITANKCTGRGTETAAGRGYNTERLANKVLGAKSHVFGPPQGSWYDNFIDGDPLDRRVECKSCIYQYPSGSFGQFRIWRKNHRLLVAVDDVCGAMAPEFVYFFLVYTIENEIEKEVGKLVVPVKQVDDILENWLLLDHQSMGEEFYRDISWHLLLKKLGVSRERFEEEDAVSLVDQEPEAID